MPPTSDISVAISTLDRPDDLARCIEALLAGTQVPAEIVVVDQSDDDATERLVAAIPAGPCAVRHIRQRARGLGVAQNAAVAAATREVVAVTDDDCIPDPTWVATLAARFAADPGLAAVTGAVLPAEAEGARVHAVASRGSATARSFAGRTLPWLVGSGNNFCVRGDWYARIGGCDVRLGPGSPGQGAVDMDLFYRLLRAGGRIDYDPAAVVLHQRQTAAERRVRRAPYGFGMGVCAVLWLRERDLYALRVMASWVFLRLERAARAAKGRRWDGVDEERLVLAGTARGVLHGIRVARTG